MRAPSESVTQLAECVYIPLLPDVPSPRVDEHTGQTGVCHHPVSFLLHHAGNGGGVRSRCLALRGHKLWTKVVA